MTLWTFRDFVSTRGENEVLAWLNTLPKKAKAKINARIITLAAYPGAWPPHYISAYVGWDDIYELRIVAAGRQFRPLGCYGPHRNQFTILVGAEEKGGKIRGSLLEVADERRQIILSDGSRCVPHDFG